jgi:hypothetical protein
VLYQPTYFRYLDSSNQSYERPPTSHGNRPMTASRQRPSSARPGSARPRPGTASGERPGSGGRPTTARPTTAQGNSSELYMCIWIKNFEQALNHFRCLFYKKVRNNVSVKYCKTIIPILCLNLGERDTCEEEDDSSDLTHGMKQFC